MRSRAVVVAFALVACRDRAPAPLTAPSASASSTASAPAPSPPASSAEPEEDAGPPALASFDAAPPFPVASGRFSNEGRATFRKAKVDAVQVARIFQSIPELAKVAHDVQLFDPNEGSFLTRSDAPHPGIVFTTQPLLYEPEPQLTILVVTGRSKSTGFVVALWAMPNDEYRLASYFLMLHDPAPIALAYSEKGKRLWWTSCWNCPGEQGYLRITDERHVVIVQQ